MTSVSTMQRFGYVQEQDEQFLALWPHRFDYLYATHPNPGAKPQWQTESRHALSDRLIQQGSYLYGVRFGSKTQYALLDIDAGSPYHPKRDKFSIERIASALEPLGLVSHLAVTSSDSQGLHLYFPFEGCLPSWQIGLAVSTLLENAGFKIMAGWLEVFPNPRPYRGGELSLYKGHRLPLQQGSSVLDKDLQPISIRQKNFVYQWENIALKNDIEEKTLQKVIKQAQRKAYQVSGKAKKFLNDLNAEIETGWTSKSQTNRLLGRIAMRSYIFGHIINQLEPLEGQSLVNDIVKIAKGLPGYKEFCNHRHEIEKRAKDWARSIETSKNYFPYGSNKLSNNGKQGSDLDRWNQTQVSNARDRITRAVKTLENTNKLPKEITERFDRLTRQGISGSTLYKHKDLWHPVHIEGQKSKDRNSPSLLLQNGCNSTDSKALEPLEDEETAEEGCNALSSNGSSSSSTSVGFNHALESLQGVLWQVPRLPRDHGPRNVDDAEGGCGTG